MSRHVAAGAIQTSVLAARAAVAGELFAKMFAGAMQADGEIVSGNAKFSRDRRDIFSVQVHALKQFAVLLRHGRQ